MKLSIRLFLSTLSSFQTGSGVKRSNDTEAGDKATKLCKYGNFVSSSNNGAVETNKSEGFILPPKKPSQPQVPSENFMSFCDNIMQQSKSESDDTSSRYKPEYQRQFDQHRQHDENQYSLPQHGVEPCLDRSYPLHNYIVVILGYGSEEPPTQVLNRSSGFCRMPVSWEYGGVPGNVVCYITIDNHVSIQLCYLPHLIL